MQHKDLIIIAITLIIIFLLSCFIDIQDKKQDKYIENLEEKVNILTVDYEKFSLEDNLNQ